MLSFEEEAAEAAAAAKAAATAVATALKAAEAAKAAAAKAAASCVADGAAVAVERGKFAPPTDGERALGLRSRKPWYSQGPPDLALERIITIAEVMRLTGLSRDSLQRHHGHLIRRLSPGRVGMKLRDALAIGGAAPDTE